MTAGVKVYGGLDSEEGWSQVSVALTELGKDDSQLAAKVVRRTTSRRVSEGEVLAGPLNDKQRVVIQTALEHAHVVVIGSGNLAPIYFPDQEERLTREQIDESYPGLIDGILRHPSTGWLLVRQADGESYILGPRGRLRLSDGALLEGQDPLVPYGPHALTLLRRYDSFRNCPDLAVNGFYDPDHDDAASFEEQMGFHGGLGGLQNRAFLFHPGKLKVEGELVGAESVHHTLVRWLAELRGEGAPPAA
jgi:hypothetical protein